MGGCRSPLSVVMEERRVKQEWMDLMRSGLVTKSTKLKHVLLERPNDFEIGKDADGRPTVKLIVESDGSAPSASGECKNTAGAIRLGISNVAGIKTTTISISAPPGSSNTS